MSGAGGLPLRLWANPHVERHGADGRGFCLDLPSADAAGGAAAAMGLALDGRGVALVVVEDGDDIGARVQAAGERLFGKAAWVVRAEVHRGAHDGQTLSIGDARQGAMPMTVLVRGRGGGDPRWYRVARTHATVVDSPAQLPLQLLPVTPHLARGHLAEDARPAANESLACVVVNAIHAYYERQVMEPAVRGFLSLLDKQFPSNSLYLFELLQNAVDDGATSVTFASTPDPARGGDGGSGGGGRIGAPQPHTALVVSHNGRKFTAMDTLGLSSVGLSTKGGAGGSKRTVGFMGIGFKAVYKRFAQVTISDGTWHFEFLEGGSGGGSSASGSGWVLLPRWVERAAADDGTERRGGGSPATEAAIAAGGCAFVLRRPRGGANAISNDLRRLPVTVPPLLGRSALARQRDAGVQEAALEFSLRWGDKGLRVTSPAAAAPRGGKQSEPPPTGVCVDETRWEGGAAVGTPRRQHWAFVCHTFVPNPAARAAFTTHTRKEASPEEETSLFFPLGLDGFPQPGVRGKPQQPGLLHAVLPTRLALPGPNRSDPAATASAPAPAAATGAHWQGPWLLSVDRQDVQSLEDNAWNAALARTLPELFVSLLRWIAKTATGGSGGSTHCGGPGLRTAESMATALAASYALVPLAQLRRSTTVPPPLSTHQVNGACSGSGGAGGGRGGQKRDHRGNHKGGGRGVGGKGTAQGGRQQQAQQQQQQQQQQQLRGLELEILGLTLPMSLLEAAISDENLVPVLTLSSASESLASEQTAAAAAGPAAGTAINTRTTAASIHVTFVRAGNAGRLPAPYTRCLPVDVMRGWLGGRHPLATHLLGTAGASPLWRRVQPPGAGGGGGGGKVDGGGAGSLAALSRAATAHAQGDEGALVVLAVRLLAAHTVCERERQALATISGGGGGSATAAGNDCDDEAGDKLDPVFLSSNGSFVSRAQLVVPGEGFERLPPAVRRLLSPTLAGAARAAGGVSGGGGGGASAEALHPDLLALLHDTPSGGDGGGRVGGGGGGGSGRGGRNSKKFHDPRGGGDSGSGRGGESPFNRKGGNSYMSTTAAADPALSPGAAAIASQLTPFERAAAVTAMRAAVSPGGGGAATVSIVPLSELALRFFSSGATDVNTLEGLGAVRALTRCVWPDSRNPTFITQAQNPEPRTQNPEPRICNP
jgi:hypothetical protein